MACEHLKPIPGVSSNETTAVTMKTIKELIAEEEAEQAAIAAKAEQAANAAEAAKARAAALRAAEPRSEKPFTSDARGVHQPPHFKEDVALWRDENVEPLSESDKPSRSLFERIFGK